MAPKGKTTKSTKAKGATVSSGESRTERSPKWPVMSPVIPATDLAYQVLLPQQILTIPRLWTASLCRFYVAFLATLPLATTPGKPKRGEAVRVNDRFQVDDAAFAARLWDETALRELITNPVVDGIALDEPGKKELWGGEVLGLNSNIRVYRYSKGQFFDQHYDDSNNIFFPFQNAPNSVPAKTTWTLLLYLTSSATGCEGGETVFHPDPANKREPAPPPIVAELGVGMALLHRHGKDCLLHEGREVTQGEKWVIRTDLCVKR